MQQSPDSEPQVARGTVPVHPLRLVLAHHRPALLRACATLARASITYYIGIGSALGSLTSNALMVKADALWLSAAAALVVILVAPVSGVLSHHFGRKPVLGLLPLCGLVFPVAIIALISGGSPLLADGAALGIACLAGGISPVGPAATEEQFLGEGRLSDLALGASVTMTVFGELTPYAAQVLTQITGSVVVPRFMIALVAWPCCW